MNILNLKIWILLKVEWNNIKKRLTSVSFPWKGFAVPLMSGKKYMMKYKLGHS